MPASKVLPGRSAAGDLSKKLRASLAAASPTGSRKSRVNIVNSSLCDDVLRRLKPSFSSAKPLDIIDINPGASLWSTKVHDALQPRRHVLVEPDKKRYRPFITPLLEEKGSRYRHISLLSDLSGPEGRRVLPDQEPVESTPNLRANTNDTLLVIANLTCTKAVLGKSSGPAGVLSLYLHDIDRQKVFHRYGLVRMLAWIADHEKSLFVPRIITDRRRLTVRMDVGTNMTEIAASGNDVSASRVRREYDLAVESQELAKQRSLDAGIWSPKDRMPPPASPPWIEVGVQPDSLDRLRELPEKLKLPWHETLISLEDEWQQHLRQAEGEAQPPQLLQRLRREFRTKCKTNGLARGWARRQAELDRVEIDLATETAENPSSPADRMSTGTKSTELNAEISASRKDLAQISRRYIDDRRGFEQHPSLLQWDRRPAEPLVVHPNDFYPAKMMTLLELEPVPDQLARLDNHEKRTCLDYVTSILFRSPSKPLSTLLNTMLQGGTEEFVQRVPSLLDPAKGGSPNLDHLRARTVPVNLIIDIALALERWPFRIPSHKMVMEISKRKPLTLYDED